MPTIRASGLVKQYGSSIALDSFDMEAGIGVTGVLGPNGAGKTTLLRCLATALAPDRGSAQILGLDPAVVAQRMELRSLIGYLPQNPRLSPHLTAFGLLDRAAKSKGMTGRQGRHFEVRRALDDVDLSDLADTKVRALSGGMVQRLVLARALLGYPELLILDEPTAGLDPEQRRLFRALISRTGKRATVLLATDHIDDIATLCDRVIVMRAGRSVFDGSPQDLCDFAAGERPADAPDEPTRPTIEDGYLLLVSTSGHPRR